MVAEVAAADEPCRNLRRVTTNPLAANDGCGGCAGQGSSVYSPDGRQIAFAWVKGAHSSAIAKVDTNGLPLRQLTPWTKGVAEKVDRSPDGSRILFSSPEFDPGRRGVCANVFTIRPDGTRLQQLTHERGGETNAGAASGSPDGKQIAYVSNRGGRNGLSYSRSSSRPRQQELVRWKLRPAPKSTAAAPRADALTVVVPAAAV